MYIIKCYYFLQLIDEQEQYYAFLRELKRNPWKNMPPKSESKVKNRSTHLEEYQSYMEFSLNLDGYMETLRVLEHELDCFNLSTVVNRIIKAKKLQQQEVDNKRKLVDTDMDEEMLFKRKSADTKTYVEASAGSEEGRAAAAEAEVGAGSSSSKGATGGAGCGGGATGGGGGGATGGAGEGAMGDLAGVARLSAPVLAPSVAKEDDADGGE